MEAEGGPSPEGRVLALDVGEKRIGLAISDMERRLAVPFDTIHRSKEGADFNAIAALVEKEEVGMLLVGLPLSLNGSVGPQARAVQKFARRLAAAVPRPVELWDERYSTVEAQSQRPLRRAAGARRRARPREGRRSGERIDPLAAAVFLQTYLDRRGTSSTS